MKTRYKQPKRNKRRTRRNAGAYEQVLGLTHGTSLSFFQDILSDRFIRANEGNAPKDVFGEMTVLNRGAFFSLVLECNTGSQIRPFCANDVILVFSRDILNYPYHISNAWCGGMQFAPLKAKVGRKGVRSYNDVEHYIDDNAPNLCNGHACNEVVFYQDIPLEHLVEVWICDTPRMIQRINHKQPNGSFRREWQNQSFDPERTAHYVRGLLESHGFDVPVKCVTHIPSLG